MKWYMYNETGHAKEMLVPCFIWSCFPKCFGPGLLSVEYFIASTLRDSRQIFFFSNNHNNNNNCCLHRASSLFCLERV